MDVFFFLATENNLIDIFLELGGEGNNLAQYKKLSRKINVGDTITVTNVYDIDGVETTLTATLHIVE